ncbi:MAG: GntR family transcriptional regulator [Pseudomonadota bacterium]
MSTEIRKAIPLRDQVYDAILTQLRNGVYAPGERVTEERVAEDLDVSRTPVREAISQLRRNGVLTARKGGGYVVPSLSVSEVAEIFVVRKLVEPHAVYLAAAEYGEREIEAIEKSIVQEERAITIAKPDKFAAGNEAFRTALFDGISNKTLIGVIHQFGNHLQFIRMLTLKNSAVRKGIVSRQKKIRDALVKSDGDLASDLWVEYLSFAEVCLLEAMDNRH